MNQSKADLMQARCKFECNARRTHAFRHRVGLASANLRIFSDCRLFLFFRARLSRVLFILATKKKSKENAPCEIQLRPVQWAAMETKQDHVWRLWKCQSCQNSGLESGRGWDVEQCDAWDVLDIFTVKCGVADFVFYLFFFLLVSGKFSKWWMGLIQR